MPLLPFTSQDLRFSISPASLSPSQWNLTLLCWLSNISTQPVISIVCSMKDTLSPSLLDTPTSDRADWWSIHKSATEDFELQSIQELEIKCDLSRNLHSSSDFQYKILYQMCRSQIGLCTLIKSHYERLSSCNVRSMVITTTECVSRILS